MKPGKNVTWKIAVKEAVLEYHSKLNPAISAREALTMKHFAKLNPPVLFSQGSIGRWKKTSREQHWEWLEPKIKLEQKEVPNYLRECFKEIDESVKMKSGAEKTNLPEDVLLEYDILLTSLYNAGTTKKRRDLLKTRSIMVGLRSARDDYNKGVSAHNEDRG